MSTDVAVPSVEWEFIGAQLLEREVRPVAIVSRDGRVVRLNRAFVFLLKAGTPVSQVPFEEWVSKETRTTFDDAWKRALCGARARAEVTLLPSSFSVEPIFDFVPMMHDGVARAVMLIMVGVAPTRVMPLLPATGLHYEVVRGSAGGPTRVVRAVDTGGELRLDAAKRCYETLHGRTVPCDVCPIGQESNKVPAVRVGSLVPFRADVIWARELRADLVAVTQVPIDEVAYRKLVSSRVDALAQTAKLSVRERKVLDLLLHGGSLDEVARAEGITRRTAKYHQENLLRKIGAESRVDLLRLVT